MYRVLRHRLRAMAFALLLLGGATACAPDDRPAPGDRPDPGDPASVQLEALGRMVLELRAAMASPDDRASFEVIVRYGLETANYPMVRGWLTHELAAAQSLVDASRTNPGARERHESRRDALARAVRRIDLE